MANMNNPANVADELFIKIEMGLMEAFNIKVEPNMTHAMVLETTDVQETISEIREHYKYAVNTLDMMKANPGKRKMLKTSKCFINAMKAIFNAYDKYAYLVMITPDDSGRNHEQIGTLAWFWMYINMLGEHKDILINALKTGAMEVYENHLQYTANKKLLMELRQRAKVLYPNAP